MPLWNNAPLVAYHGTDFRSLSSYNPVKGQLLVGFTVDLDVCRPTTDFGKGFYLTTSLEQARNWANVKADRRRSKALILKFELDREWLASLDSLCFVLADTPFYNLVADCRGGIAPHQRPGSQQLYDVVYGPVTLKGQTMVVQNADQISFHSDVAASALPEPAVDDIATANDGQLPRDML
ncbi:DUF3990 domain-containing protein [Bradyrhizobium sp. SSUT77]|uniref:DUF3990 domain-containing protein n=1 Tax=Bradyrhizobium sp. SSUT77 TaxID=3040603 RepID=UPI00244A377D|nr:DUF3990 domain-containing protein [Bradyrhizobium sp. SSUT77]MDH2346813.1 DUF3990 domain-containing protein [Bradyrhizobium sp. SSUT77]